jgi:hypothetical protein
MRAALSAVPGHRPRPWTGSAGTPRFPERLRCCGCAAALSPRPSAASAPPRHGSSVHGPVQCASHIRQERLPARRVQLQAVKGDSRGLMEAAEVDIAMLDRPGSQADIQRARTPSFGLPPRCTFWARQHPTRTAERSTAGYSFSARQANLLLEWSPEGINSGTDRPVPEAGYTRLSPHRQRPCFDNELMRVAGETVDSRGARRGSAAFEAGAGAGTGPAGRRQSLFTAALTRTTISCGISAQRCASGNACRITVVPSRSIPLSYRSEFPSRGCVICLRKTSFSSAESHSRGSGDCLRREKRHWGWDRQGDALRWTSRPGHPGTCC